MRNRLPLPPRFILLLLKSRRSVEQSRSAQQHSAKRSADGSINALRISRVSLSQMENCQQRTNLQLSRCRMVSTLNLAPSVFDFELAFIKALGHPEWFYGSQAAVCRRSRESRRFDCCIAIARVSTRCAARIRDESRASELQRAAQWPRDKSEINL